MGFNVQINLHVLSSRRAALRFETGSGYARSMVSTDAVSQDEVHWRSLFLVDRCELRSRVYDITF
jgi:hypothetical protein